MEEESTIGIIDLGVIDLDALRNLHSPVLRRAYLRLAEDPDDLTVAGWSSAI
ncbi:FxSxx-COOH cyclophane-containing RiPP peptide [Nonomuraea sp. NPDC048881]|uniref:FxSxx-COOH cyclophane-containing RiPP peptide n=1 Tax=unclassified Nonomuraea TaxID=2593643 RepID=UPI0034099300